MKFGDELHRIGDIALIYVDDKNFGVANIKVSKKAEKRIVMHGYYNKIHDAVRAMAEQVTKQGDDISDLKGYIERYEAVWADIKASIQC